jgi:hypothetical protein
VLLEVLGKLEKSSDLIGNRSCYLPACSVVLQPTVIQRALTVRTSCVKCETFP